jgi:hypothetical protein
VRITGAPETCRRKPEAVPNYLAGIDTCLFDASGNPTITLPCGFTDAGGRLRLITSLRGSGRKHCSEPDTATNARRTGIAIIGR